MKTRKTNKTKRTSKKKPKLNKVYQIVTDRIIDKLTKGVIPWKSSWKTSNLGLNQNAVSRQPYQGINAFITEMQGYSSKYWLSYKQALQIGGSVRSGEKGTPVVFFLPVEKVKKTRPGETADKQDNGYAVLRYSVVFNSINVKT